MSKLLNLMSSFSIQAGDDGEYGRSKTLTTIGSGTITIADQAHSTDIDTINRDTTNSTLDIYDFKQQGADVDMTVDTRLLSEEGKKDIVKDVKTNEVGVEAISDVVMQDSVEIGDTINHLTTKLNYLNAANIFAAENPELAQVLNDKDATPEQKEAAYSAYVDTIVQTFGVDRDQAVKLMATHASTEEGEEIKGAHVDGGNHAGDIYVNDLTNDNGMEVANTLGHEATHYLEDNTKTIRNRGDAGNEVYANLMGTASADYLDFAYGNMGLGGLSTGYSNNHNGITMPSVFNSSAPSANTQSFLAEQAAGNTEYSSFAVALPEGGYQVVDSFIDGSKTIYEVNTDNIIIGAIGQSLTEYSFLGDSGEVVNAYIDVSDNSGVAFMNDEIIDGDPSIIEYIQNAGNGKTYDFKDRGIDNKMTAKEKDLYRYRTMPFDGVFGYINDSNLPTYGTARDFGNVAAGYVSDNNGLPWIATRFGFDAYNGSAEGQTSQQAQRLGYNLSGSNNK